VARLKAALRARVVPVTHGGIVGLVWRGRGARQAGLARALAAATGHHVEIVVA
jgi:hypothetical protein